MKKTTYFVANKQGTTATEPVISTSNTKLYTNFGDIVAKKSYVPLTGCVLEHILTTSQLSDLEKLFYLLADSLALVNSQINKTLRNTALPATKWAEKLGCSRSQVFTIQKNLARKGYLLIQKGKNGHGQDKRNLLTTTLPDDVFETLCKTPDRVRLMAAKEQVFEHNTGNKREYLDKTKLFIPLNYKLLSEICQTTLIKPFTKILWLDLFSFGYKCFITKNAEDQGKDKKFSLTLSHSDLLKRYNVTKQQISRTITSLQTEGFIYTKRLFVKKEGACGVEERQDKSLWNITLSMPETSALKTVLADDRASPDTANDTDTNPDTIDGIDEHDPKHRSPQLEAILKEMDNTVRMKTSLQSKTVAELEEESKEVAELSAKKAKDDYTEALICELEHLEKEENLSTKADEIPSETFNSRNGIIGFDPQVANSDLYINKYSLENTKELSNLEASIEAPQVISKNSSDFKDFKSRYSNKKSKMFNISLNLIREKIKKLSKEKADKARKFAYSLYSKKLTKGYAAELSKAELAKQIIFHAATWKPTKAGDISPEKQVDIALSVAWKRITDGSWECPFVWQKAETLQNEYFYYQQKYQKSGIIAREVDGLQVDVSKLLGRGYDVIGEITKIPYDPGIPLAELMQGEGRKCTACGNKQDLCEETEEEFDTILEKIHPYSQKLDHIPSEEKQVVLTTYNDQDHVTVEYRQEGPNGNKYYFELNQIESNHEGDWIVTLKPVSYKVFGLPGELEGKNGGMSTKESGIGRLKHEMDDSRYLSHNSTGFGLKELRSKELSPEKLPCTRHGNQGDTSGYTDFDASNNPYQEKPMILTELNDIDDKIPDFDCR